MNPSTVDINSLLRNPVFDSNCISELLAPYLEKFGSEMKIVPEGFRHLPKEIKKKFVKGKGKITLSVFKADIGSIGGHIRPSKGLVLKVWRYLCKKAKGLLIDFQVSFTGDDIAILCTHPWGVDNAKVHKLAWDAFSGGSRFAKAQGLYGAGQDLLVDAFSGNIRGMGPAIAEMEFPLRKAEPFLFFAADKTDPGAYNLPYYLALCDPMYTPGLFLSPEMMKGFKFTIMDVDCTEGDKVIELHSGTQLMALVALLRDPERFVIEQVHTNNGEIVAVISTTRLHNIGGFYVGKDDPVSLVRLQGNFPAAGEFLKPYALGHLVAGCMRGSHQAFIMPVKQGESVSWFDGPPVVSCGAFCVNRFGKLIGPADAFNHPFWDYVRNNVSRKNDELHRQGFIGGTMLPYGQLEYQKGFRPTFKGLLEKFKIRPAE